jgi:predicted DNA-binding protein (UPF0251 family)
MVSAVPNVTYFKPAGIPLSFLNEIRLSVEEAEALRLKDLEGLEQIEGAVSMGVSRPTFQRVLSSARKKVADALLNGKAIKIQGGSFQVTGTQLPCGENQYLKISGSEGEIDFKSHRCCGRDAKKQLDDIQLLKAEEKEAPNP